MRGFSALVALIASIAFALPAAGAAEISHTGALGDIPLVDQSGATFHLRDLGGQPVAITFIATRCMDTCPIVNAVFARLSQSTPHVRFITISLDPAYDTPFVMAGFAHEMNAKMPVWRMLTGAPADVRHVLGAFGVTIERGNDGIPDAHSDFVYVLDRRGHLVKTLPLSTNSVAELRRALTQPLL